VATSHAWAFRARFRRNAFGWRGTRKAIERLNEAVGEIDRMARTDPALAGEGAVLLLEKLSPAVNQIDSSSGALGNAANGVIERMVPLIAAAPVPRRVREKWLDRLLDAIQDDDPPHIESLSEHLGALCADPALASHWAGQLLPMVRLVLVDRRSNTYAYSKSSTLCYSALFYAGRLTRTLVDEGFVLHDRASGRYRPGPEAFAVGLAAEPSYTLQRLAAPTLRALAIESGDTGFFKVLHGYESICLSRDEGDFPIRNQLSKPGDRWPLGVGAGSCAILAALSDEVIDDALLRSAKLRAERFSRCTDTAIRRLVRDTRSRGYCLQPGMVIEDSWAVGAVVCGGNGQPVASISIAAIKSRLGTARSAAMGNRLMQASHGLTLLQTEAADRSSL